MTQILEFHCTHLKSSREAPRFWSWSNLGLNGHLGSELQLVRSCNHMGKPGIKPTSLLQSVGFLNHMLDTLEMLIYIIFLKYCLSLSLSLSLPLSVSFLLCILIAIILNKLISKFTDTLVLFLFSIVFFFFFPFWIISLLGFQAYELFFHDVIFDDEL